MKASDGATIVTRSSLEAKVIDDLRVRNVPFEYEREAFDILIPAKINPDLFFPNGLVVEIKGYFPTEDRRKMLALKRQRPDLNLRMVFANPHTRCGKTSKTTYAMWCDKHGIPWASKVVPKEWLS